jgi:hypothetical protein
MDPNMPAQASQGSAVVGAIAGLVSLAFLVVMIIANWKIYTKAGKPGWACLVPIYNAVVLMQIVGKSPWLVLLILIPYLGGLILWIIAAIGLANVFGKGVGFAVGLILLSPIFVLILAFGSATYTSPEGGPAAAPAAV